MTKSNDFSMRASSRRLAGRSHTLPSHSICQSRGSDDLLSRSVLHALMLQGPGGDWRTIPGIAADAPSRAKCLSLARHDRRYSNSESLFYLNLLSRSGNWPLACTERCGSHSTRERSEINHASQRKPLQHHFVDHQSGLPTVRRQHAGIPMQW